VLPPNYPKPLVAICNGAIPLPIFSLQLPKLQLSSLTPLVLHPMISSKLS